MTSLIIAGLIIVAAIVVYFEFIVPAYSTLEGVKGQEESEVTLYANAQNIATQGKALLATYQNDASSSQSVAMVLPVGSDVSGAIAQIYGIATNANVTVQNIGISAQAIQATTPQGGTGSGQLTSAAAAGSVLKPTGTISFQVTGLGSYESFKSFLAGLETNIRIFNVTTISLQPVGIIATKTQAANPDMFNYAITVVTYYQAP